MNAASIQFILDSALRGTGPHASGVKGFRWEERYPLTRWGKTQQGGIEINIERDDDSYEAGHAFFTAIRPLLPVGIRLRVLTTLRGGTTCISDSADMLGPIFQIQRQPAESSRAFREGITKAYGKTMGSFEETTCERAVGTIVYIAETETINGAPVVAWLTPKRVEPRPGQHRRHSDGRRCELLDVNRVEASPWLVRWDDRSLTRETDFDVGRTKYQRGPVQTESPREELERVIKLEAETPPEGVTAERWLVCLVCLLQVAEHADWARTHGSAGEHVRRRANDMRKQHAHPEAMFRLDVRDRKIGIAARPVRGVSPRRL